jgi:hypothetical protein
MNLKGYDAWKTTEPLDYPDDIQDEPEAFILDEPSEEWLEFWMSITLPFKPSEGDDEIHGGGNTGTRIRTAA